VGPIESDVLPFYLPVCEENTLLLVPIMGPTSPQGSHQHPNSIT
jgi:hypothetical protein